MAMMGWLRRLRRRASRPAAVTPAMQQKMARALVTRITSGGMAELSHAKQMATGFGLRRAHFEQMATPPEEDFARENLKGQFQ